MTDIDKSKPGSVSTLFRDMEVTKGTADMFKLLPLGRGGTVYLGDKEVRDVFYSCTLKTLCHLYVIS